MELLKSSDYWDYVIKDGNVIGAFEKMYRNCPDPRLKGATGAHVTALDISPTAVRIAKQRYPDIESWLFLYPPCSFPKKVYSWSFLLAMVEKAR